jgi:hypothetical protein
LGADLPLALPDLVQLPPPFSMISGTILSSGFTWSALKDLFFFSFYEQIWASFGVWILPRRNGLGHLDLTTTATQLGRWIARLKSLNFSLSFSVKSRSET